MNLSEGELCACIARMHYYYVKIEKDVIGKSSLSNSVSVPDEAINALPTLLKVMYTVC